MKKLMMPLADKISDNAGKNKDVIISGAVFFILSYGMLLFNKISVHDDVSHLFGIGATYNLGRWGLGIYEILFEGVIGNQLWSLPAFNGALVFVHSMITCCLLIDFFGLNTRCGRILFTLVMVSSPGLICMMGYLFTAPAYTLGILCAVISGILLSRLAIRYETIPNKDRWIMLIGGELCGAFSLGIYQSYVSFTLAIGIFSLIAYASRTSFRKAIGCLVRAVIYISLVFAIYLLIMKVSLKLTKVELGTYKGVDKALQLSAAELIRRVKLAFREFFWPHRIPDLNMFPFNAWWAYMLILVISIIMITYILIKRKDINNKWLVILLMILVPVCVNISFIIAGSGYYYMMFYANTMLFGGLLWGMETQIVPEAGTKDRKMETVRKTLQSVILCAIIFIGCIFIRYSNQAAMKGLYIQNEYANYLTSLVTRIQSTDGYTTDTQILFTNEQNTRELDIPKEFKEISIQPYRDNPLKYSVEHRRRFRTYLQQWCGFSAAYVEEDALKDKSVIDSMPSYPDDGSIKMVDGIIVVKF